MHRGSQRAIAFGGAGPEAGSRNSGMTRLAGGEKCLWACHAETGLRRGQSLPRKSLGLRQLGLGGSGAGLPRLQEREAVPETARDQARQVHGADTALASGSTAPLAAPAGCRFHQKDRRCGGANPGHRNCCREGG